jgi:hypothetical protein
MAQRGPVCTQSCKRTQLAATSGHRRSGPLRGARAPLALAIAAFAALLIAPAGASAQSNYTLPPTLATNQWYWEISPSANGLAGLPAVTGTYPAPGSANIWDTDMFADSNANGGVPTGPSPVVQALHAAGKYSICYIEAGAQQAEPDSSNFAVADYQNGSSPTTTEEVGWPGEYWYDTRGFANYVAGDNSTLTGAAANIAAGMAKRIEDCAIEGQDALEPDDLDGYTNPSQTGAAGGGWGLTQTDAAGYERWLAYTAHSDGLAVFQKNDTANASVDEPIFDGMIIEECNYYQDPCAGSGGDATAYLAAGKPVLNAEYTQDGETTAKFCSANIAARLTGALFDVNLDGSTYQPCAPATTRQSSPPVGPANTVAPAIAGTPAEGDTLTAGTGTWSGTVSLTYTYAWSDGRTGSMDTLSAADVGKSISVTVTAKNSAGGASATSSSVGPVTAPVTVPVPAAPVNTGLPVVSGTPQQGDTLTASAGTWTGSAPITYSYLWSDGTTQSADVLSAAGVGKVISVTVTATNSAASVSVTSASVGPVTSSPLLLGSVPFNTQLPALRGTARQGKSLKVSAGSWSNGPTSYSYQWQLCKSGVCSHISGATKSSYKLGSADVSDTLDAVVTAKNAYGSTTATSTRSAVVATRRSSALARFTAKRVASKHRTLKHRQHRRSLRHRLHR